MRQPTADCPAEKGDNDRQQLVEIDRRVTTDRVDADLTNDERWVWLSGEGVGGAKVCQSSDQRAAA